MVVVVAIAVMIGSGCHDDVAKNVICGVLRAVSTILDAVPDGTVLVLSHHP
jgi:hypothetical protein